jgi:tetrapyrrole (corrin/porphyrin) methylase-like protein
MAYTNLYVLGSGIYSGLQLSIETIQALRISDMAFVLHDDVMVLEKIREYCSDTRSVLDLYEQGISERRLIYRAIADRVVNEAASGKTVSFVVHGHPLFLVSASEYILELARKRGLIARALPAVSSFDCILCDLGIDLGYAVQIYDPTTMLQQGILPNPNVPLLLFQLTTILNDNVVRDDPQPECLTPLVEYLKKVYPKDHPCILLHVGSHLLETGRQLELTIESLDKSKDLELWKRPTLYVPPREPVPQPT